MERKFDICVHDVKIATETLDRNRPDKFFDVVYRLPFELVKGKTDSLGQPASEVTVKFEAGKGSTAGGLFGLRVVRRGRVKSEEPR